MPFVSIDFGTTRCSIVISLTRLLELVKDPEGDTSNVPSCVAQSKTGWLIGCKAAQKQTADPSNVVFDMKYMLIKSVRELDRMVLNWPFDAFISSDSNTRIKIRLDMTDFWLDYIVQIMFHTFIHWAQTQLGEPIHEIILNVPSHLNEVNRSRFQRAAQTVHIKQVHVIDDHMAAALVYNRQRSRDADSLVIILNQGASSLNGSIFIFSKLDPIQLEYVNVSRGGECYDRNLFKYIRSQCSEAEKQLLDRDRIQRFRVLDACKRAKHELTDAMEAHIDLPVEVSSGFSIKQTISRELFERINEDMFVCVRQVLQCLLQKSEIHPDEIDEVVLVGGSTRVPKLLQVISAYFDGKVAVNTDFSFDHVFACGGALHLAKMKRLSITRLPGEPILTQDSFGVASNMCSLTTNRSIVSEAIGFMFDEMPAVTMFEANNTIPCRREWTFYTLKDCQAPAFLHVWVGRGPDGTVTDTDRVVALSCPAIPPTPKGTPVLQITFNLDVNGTLTVEVKDRCSGKGTSVILPNLCHHEYDSGWYRFKSSQNLERYRTLLKCEVKIINRTLCYDAAKCLLSTEQRTAVKHMCDAIDSWLASTTKITLNEVQLKRHELFDLWIPCVRLIYPNAVSK